MIYSVGRARSTQPQKATEEDSTREPYLRLQLPLHRDEPREQPAGVGLPGTVESVMRHATFVDGAPHVYVSHAWANTR